MVLIKIDKELLIMELYNLLSKIDIKEEDARNQVLYIIKLINNYPEDKNQGQYPKISGMAR